MEYNQISGIYKIQNLKDNKVYIGSAVDVAGRLRRHLRCLRLGVHQAVHLQCSWNLHGPEAFTFEVLETLEDRTQLVTREQLYIWLYDAANPEHGYNTCSMAGSILGVKLTPATRAKMSKAMQGNQNGKYGKGRKLTSEHRAKISVDQKGRVRSAEFKAKVSRAMTGRICSASMRAKISALKIGNQYFKGRKHTPETIAKMSATKKLWWSERRNNCRFSL